MKPPVKRKEPELDETLSAAVETKRTKTDRCFLKNQSKRRRSEDSPTQITPTNKRIISRDGNFSLRLSEVDELISPCPSLDPPSYHSASSSLPAPLPTEGPVVPDSVTAEQYISDFYNKLLSAAADNRQLEMLRAQQAFEASPAPVRRLVAKKVGLSTEVLREKIYGEVSVYG